MIRHTPTVSMLRFYEQDDPGPFAPYVAICTLVWESKHVVWMNGLHGALTRRLFRQLVDFCVANGITTIKAHRDPARKLPFGVPVDDHIEVTVADALGGRA